MEFKGPLKAEAAVSNSCNKTTLMFDNFTGPELFYVGGRGGGDVV